MRLEWRIKERIYNSGKKEYFVFQEDIYDTEEEKEKAIKYGIYRWVFLGCPFKTEKEAIKYIRQYERDRWESVIKSERYIPCEID